eukprot:6524019-Alexandrium_andersonii.AAC.1
MLARVEQGAQWPRQMRRVLLSDLAKTDERSTAPLQYRGISLLPILYRTWAKLRLADVREWSERWMRGE